MKKILLLWIALCLLLSAAACAPTDPNIGKYVCVSICRGEKNESPSDEWIVLDRNGKGVIHIGIELNMRWHAENGELTVDTDFIVNTYTGTLRDGELVLTVDDAVYTFVPEGRKKEWVLAQETGFVLQETEEVCVDAAAVGHYVCTAISKNGDHRVPDNYWIDLCDDGSTMVYFGIKYPGKWQMQNDILTITLNNEDVFIGSITGEEMRLEGDTSYLLQRLGDPGSGEEGALSAQSALLQSGSRWSGILRVKYHSGEGILKDGEYDIVGLIVEEQGEIRFELYYKNKENGKPFASFPVNLRNHFVEPLLDEETEDAWLFAHTLEKDDAFDLTMFLDSKDRLDFTFAYETKAEQAELYVRVAPESAEP